jgi:hypothetical protein
MNLDGFLRCTCIRDGKAKPHPFPARLIFDESGEPTLTGNPFEEEWEAHDRGLGESCKHEGYLLSLFLGNITRVGNRRGFLQHLRGAPGPRFPNSPGESSLRRHAHRRLDLQQDREKTSEGSRCRTPFQRHSGRFRKRVLQQYEASVRGQRRNWKPRSCSKHSDLPVWHPSFIGAEDRGKS